MNAATNAVVSSFLRIPGGASLRENIVALLVVRGRRLCKVQRTAAHTGWTAAWLIPVGPTARQFVPPHRPHAIAYPTAPTLSPT